jgi:uncharacterized membrane protein
MNLKLNNLAILAHLPILGILITLTSNSGEDKDDFVSFYNRQNLGINIIIIFGSVIAENFNSIYITSLFWILILSSIIYSVSGVFKNKKNILPVIGNYFQNQFKNI